MQFRTLLIASALAVAASAMFDHGPKYGSSHPFKPVYLNPYGSKYESYGKYDDHGKDSHYEPSYYHDSYEPKYGGHGGGHGGNDYYSTYQPSHQPYYGSASSYYHGEPQKYNDYHGSQNYYDKY